MFWSDDYTCAGITTVQYSNGSDYMSGRYPSTWISFSNEKLLAIAAAEKDRLYWSFPIVLFRLWEYIPAAILLALRLMFSLSGWLARVGKKRKSGN